MPQKNLSGIVALQRRKTKSALFVALENELIEPIAEATDSIVENDRVCRGGGLPRPVIFILLQGCCFGVGEKNFRGR